MNPFTPAEMAEHDAWAGRQLHHADFIKAHPEHLAPKPARDLAQFIAEDPNIDPALRAFFTVKPCNATEDLLNRAAAKQKPRAFSGEPITGLGELS